jgi:hypothetical protein
VQRRTIDAKSADSRLVGRELRELWVFDMLLPSAYTSKMPMLYVPSGDETSRIADSGPLYRLSTVANALMNRPGGTDDARSRSFFASVLLTVLLIAGVSDVKANDSVMKAPSDPNEWAISLLCLFGGCSVTRSSIQSARATAVVAAGPHKKHGSATAPLFVSACDQSSPFAERKAGPVSTYAHRDPA